MKTILLFVLSVALALRSTAQERWTVVLNSKALLAANTEDSVNNVVTLNDLKKGTLVVTYTPGKVQSGLSRRIAVYDAMDNELYSKEALSIVIPVANLKKWQRDTLSPIKIYTWPVSKDPAIKLKVRRVHLCTINLAD